MLYNRFILYTIPGKTELSYVQVQSTFMVKLKFFIILPIKYRYYENCQWVMLVWRVSGGRNCLPFASTCVHPRFLVGSVLLNLWFCLLCFTCLRLVSCVSVVSVSGLSILYCPFGFL